MVDALISPNQAGCGNQVEVVANEFVEGQVDRVARPPEDGFQRQPTLIGGLDRVPEIADRSIQAGNVVGERHGPDDVGHGHGHAGSGAVAVIVDHRGPHGEDVDCSGVGVGGRECPLAGAVSLNRGLGDNIAPVDVDRVGIELSRIGKRPGDCEFLSQFDHRAVQFQLRHDRCRVFAGNEDRIRPHATVIVGDGQGNLVDAVVVGCERNLGSVREASVRASVLQDYPLVGVRVLCTGVNHGTRQSHFGSFGYSWRRGQDRHRGSDVGDLERGGLDIGKPVRVGHAKCDCPRGKVVEEGHRRLPSGQFDVERGAVVVKIPRIQGDSKIVRGTRSVKSHLRSLGHGIRPVGIGGGRMVSDDRQFRGSNVGHAEAVGNSKLHRQRLVGSQSH